MQGGSTTATGWIYYLDYYTSNCSSTPIESTIAAVGICIPTVTGSIELNTAITGTILYVTLNNYTDDSCSKFANKLVEEAELDTCDGYIVVSYFSGSSVPASTMAGNEIR